MTNTISKPDFSSGMKRLEAAFMKDVSQGTLKIYFEKLKGVTRAKFFEVVEKTIDEDDFFPSIAKLRKRCNLKEYFPD